VYIRTNWFPILNTTNVNILVNINQNDYMYGIIIYASDESLMFISCIDMIDLYKNLIINRNSEPYIRLRFIENICSFIKNLHICKFCFDKFVSKQISDEQLRKMLIASTNNQ